MVEITKHAVNECNEKLIINAMDDVGSGGAHHLYKIEGFNSATNPSDPWVAFRSGPSTYSHILFQNGPIKEAGVNGVTHEALLAIVAHRLKCFQNGPFANVFNGKALSLIEAALDTLKARTLDRLSRGVEGTHQQ
jgi:hypothetical protein